MVRARAGLLSSLFRQSSVHAVPRDALAKRNPSMKFLIILLWLLLSIAGLTTPAIQAQDLSSFFKHTKGAFVLYDSKHNRYVRYNERRCRERFSPKSTFKIPNSLIGL